MNYTSGVIEATPADRNQMRRGATATTVCSEDVIEVDVDAEYNRSYGIYLAATVLRISSNTSSDE